MNQYKLYTMDEEKTCCNEDCKEEVLTERDTDLLEARPGRPLPTNGIEEPDGYNRTNNHIHDLVVKQMDLGYLVKVGCQTLCLETKERLIELFIAYVNDPDKTMNKHYKGNILSNDE